LFLSPICLGRCSSSIPCVCCDVQQIVFASFVADILRQPGVVMVVSGPNTGLREFRHAFYVCTLVVAIVQNPVRAVHIPTPPLPL
jgi:hypothetical protein